MVVKRLAVATLALISLGGVGVAVAQLLKEEGRIGPFNRVQPSGRQLKPVGKKTQLGNFPTGAALTPSGRFLWTLSTGRGINDIRIVRVSYATSCRKGRRGRSCRLRRMRRQGQVIQTIRMPGLSGGIVMAPDGETAYVSGVPDSERKDQKSPEGIPGKGGDVIHVFKHNRRSGVAERAGVIGVPPPSDAPSPQSFPPTRTDRISWPRDLAISPDGKTLLAALNLADYAAVIDTQTKGVRYVKVNTYPYGAAITRDGKYGLVSNESSGFVSVIDLANARKLKDIRVGPHLSHPEGIAIDPKRPRAYVAVTNQDLVAVIDTEKLEVERTLSVEQPEGIGTTPVSVSVTPGASRLLVSDAGEDAIAVFSLTGDAPELIGRIPVSSYPVFASATADRKRLVWVTARGLGVGPFPRGPNPTDPRNSDDEINTFQYLPTSVRGMSGLLHFPSAAEIRKMTPTAQAQLRPSNSTAPPEGTPIREPGSDPKIKYVFYFVKENRTYDQVLGDDPRGDGDPNLTLFGENITPNLHALAKRFPLLDHVYANSEASIDGHFWTSAAAVSDYVTKAWHQNYGGRKRPYDFGAYVVTYPPRKFLLDQAAEQGISYFNYGEAITGISPLPDKDRTQAELEENNRKLLNSSIGDLGYGCYPGNLSTGTLLSQPDAPEVYDSSVPPGAKQGAVSRFDCFRDGHFTVQLLTNSVPRFNMLMLNNNHTVGTRPGARTPRAMVAENDYGLGQFVDLISHSPIWKESLILVVEDDSQDGADHVDAHRIPALAISPYAKRGAVVHTRYDQLSFIRTLEIVLGMKPLNLFDALAVPLYDAFSSESQNGEPFNAISPKISLTERNTAAAANARLSRGLNFRGVDLVPQRVLDKILWQSIHGRHSRPPPPGPNASGRDEEEAEDEEVLEALEELRRGEPAP